MLCVGTGVVAKKLTAAVIVSQASRQDVIIMKDSVLKGRGVNHTTPGANCYRFCLPVKFSTVVAPRNVMGRTKDCC